MANVYQTGTVTSLLPWCPAVSISFCKWADQSTGRAQDMLPGHPETPECHLNTLKGRRTTKTECHCVSLQESNNKRQRLKNSNFLKFHNHQFATKLRSNTWTSKYAKLSLGTWSQMNTPGFSHKRLITPWWILEKEAWLTCELTRKRLPKTSIFDALPLWKATGSSESNVHLTAWQFLSQRMRHFCSLGTQSLPHLTKAHDNTEMDV